MITGMSVDSRVRRVNSNGVGAERAYDKYTKHLVCPSRDLREESRNTRAVYSGEPEPDNIAMASGLVFLSASPSLTLSNLPWMSASSG